MLNAAVQNVNLQDSPDHGHLLSFLQERFTSSLLDTTRFMLLSNGYGNPAVKIRESFPSGLFFKIV